MAKRIYVGNMNYATSEQSLRDRFTQYGEASSVNIIVDQYTGQTEGFGSWRRQTTIMPKRRYPRSTAGISRDGLYG